MNKLNKLSRNSASQHYNTADQNLPIITVIDNNVNNDEYSNS